jgi:hypothetical protein
MEPVYMTDKEIRQCPSCGGFCKKSGCERENVPPKATQKPVAWLHRMDNTEGIKSNGKGIVLIDQYRRHPFGLVGVDFDESYPITSTPLYKSPQQKPWIGLTDDEIKGIIGAWGDTPIKGYTRKLFDQIETKLKEKNT